MNAEHMDTRQPFDRDTVVTYTRVSPRRRPKQSVVRPSVEDIGPELMLDGAEIHSVLPDEPAIFDFPADDRRRGRDDLIVDFIEDARRPDWLRYGMVAASLAVIAGVGILAATVGVATMLPGSPSPSGGSGAPTLALNSPDLGAEPGLTTGGIREIPMSSGAPDATARTEVAPPIPRPRPDDVPAPAALEPGVTAQSAPAVETDVTASAPMQASSDIAAAPPPPPAAPPVRPAPADDGTASLISSIEATLARVDAKRPPAPLEIQPPATGSPVMMTQPIYPPPADVAPPPTTGSIDPPDDIAPPPATVDGYVGYSTGPVPPEPVPVPDFYPQAPQLNPATPGSYQSDLYAFPPVRIEETEVRRPGLLRRTLTKATSAVGWVFARN